VGCSQNTVSRGVVGSSSSRLGGLGDEPRPGRPQSISAERVEDALVAMVKSPPKYGTHW
jgi:hypothetical protein